MALADLVKSAAAIARNIVVPGGLSVQCKITVNSTHTGYNPVTETTTEGGSLLPVPGVRYQEKLNLTTGLTVHHHKTDGLVQYTEMLMLFASDLGANVVKQDDYLQILGDDGATWERWQIKTVDTPPTRPIFICVIERS